jgi:kynurenine formamidase
MARPAAPAMSEKEVLELFTTCSNWGRWGKDDERGTLNYITPEKRVRAASLVKTGLEVSLGRDLSTRWTPANSVPIVHKMLYGGHDNIIAALDSVDIAPHGFRITHLDAIGHVYFQGGIYNGRRAADAVAPGGMSFASVHALREGVFTRGVFLDVARARGVAYLQPDDGIFPEDLDAAERLAGVKVEPGDAIFVRCGLGSLEEVDGEEDPARRAGIMAESVPWIHKHQVAVYSGDCVERLPSRYPSVPLPLHMVGLVAMGLIMLDNPDVEVLAEAVRSTGRSEFLITCAPLRVPGGTGSAVNPIAVF